MRDRTRQSRFTPRRTPPESLEAVHVHMDGLLERAFKGVKESAASKKKQHFLFHGSRGSGKSHLVRLLEYRISQDEALGGQLRIAWLNEDESSTTFLDLLVRTYRALAERYPEVFPLVDLEKLYGKDPELVLPELEALLRERLAGRTLLMLLENADGVFTQLSQLDLKRWRAFLQNDACVTTVATAQQLVGEVREHEEPFYGFFDTYHLRPFTVEEAVEFLKGVARENGDTDLLTFLATPQGKARVRALHRLSGGNPRLYVVFSDFVTHEALDRLVPLFEELVDEQLTPYYQERLRWLSPLQRKIVEVLCARRSPVPVKDIGAALFTGATSIATQLKRLREMGYVAPNPRGREVLYELAEPLMRLSLEVKKTDVGEPLHIIVDFLRVWYDLETLQDWAEPGDKAKAGGYTRVYARAAAEAYYEGGSHLRLEFLRQDLDGLVPRSCDAQQLEHFRAVAEESEDVNDWHAYARAVYYVRDRSEAEGALAFFEKILAETEVASDQQAGALLGRGLVHGALGEPEKELADYSAILELDGAPLEQRAWALYTRGVALGELGHTEEELADYGAVLELDGAPVDQRARALVNRGVVLGNLGRNEEGLTDYGAVLELDGAPVDQRAWALYNRGVALGELGRNEEALADYGAVLELDEAPVDQRAWALYNRGVALGTLGRNEEALADYGAVLELDGAPVDQRAKALNNRGVVLGNLGRTEEALADYGAVLELDGAPVDQRAWALVNRGVVLGNLGRNEEALADYGAVLELDGAPVDQRAWALYNRGVALRELGRNEEALVDHQTVVALEVAPAFIRSKACANLGLIYSGQGEHNTAARWRWKALHYGGTVPPSVIREMLSEILSDLSTRNDWQGFLDTFSAYLADEPEASSASLVAEEVFQFFLKGDENPKMQGSKVTDLWELHRQNGQLAALGNGLVRSLKYVSGSSAKVGDFDVWVGLWHDVAGDTPEFELPLRLLDTGIAYLKSRDANGKGDRGTLLNLPAEEREIVCEALRIDFLKE